MIANVLCPNALPTIDTLAIRSWDGSSYWYRMRYQNVSQFINQFFFQWKKAVLTFLTLRSSCKFLHISVTKKRGGSKVGPEVATSVTSILKNNINEVRHALASPNQTYFRSVPEWNISSVGYTYGDAYASYFT